MRYYLALGLTLSMNVFAVDQTGQPKELEKIRILPVKRTPEAEASRIVVALPEDGATIEANPVWMQMRVDGYPIGAASQFDRADELAVSKLGQTFHVVIDNNPYFCINEPALDPFNEAGWYYETSYKFEVPMKLENGEHVVRTFLARSYGESLKGELTYNVSTFYVDGDGKAHNFKKDLSKPYLTYNEPSNNLYLVENKPILLDFLISNCELSEDGYQVRLTVDGRASRLLTAWNPYYLYGLKAGNHTVRLQLLDQNGKYIGGPFNDVTHTITVH